MRTNLGRVSALPRGSWTEETTYNKGDVVRNVKSVYIALQESKNVEPGVSFLWSQFWKLIATDGDQTDVALLSESLNLANTVIGMEVSAESAPYGSPISIESLIDEGGQFLGLSFQIPKNSEFDFPPIVASMYSYNGTVLPALPEWDKETYPYAVIWQAQIFHLVETLIVSAEPPTVDGSSVHFGDCLLFSQSVYDEWEDSEEETDLTYTIDTTRNSAPIWCNSDLKNTDGTVYLSASEPVPVYEPI